MKQLYLLLITLLVSLSAYAEKSGTCGKNLQWKLTDEGVLTITGTGKMKNWDYNNHSPWHADKSVKQVIIGDGVTKIGSNVFSGCLSLTSVTIGNSVRTIEEGAFYDCHALTSVTIPNSVTTIESSVFYDCRALTSVTIPNSVTKIGSNAFSGCKNVKQITSEAAMPPRCFGNVFEEINTKECKLIVPKNSVDAYKKADGWKEFFLIEGTTTGIINNIYNKIDNVDVYTIDGVKCLSKASANEINALPKGIYIINGKKIIIK